MKKNYFGDKLNFWAKQNYLKKIKILKNYCK